MIREPFVRVCQGLDRGPDAMLAGTALHHGLAIVTRNEREFRNTGARVVNPWTDTSQ